MNKSAWLFVVLLNASAYSSSVSESHNWDILIFTQHWAVTACLQWKEVIPTHTCVLPSVKNGWMIHGIWPTKLGTFGPSFCNSSWHFDPKQLDPIESKLEEYWGDIHTGNRFALWHHEWDKHGTCAASLPELASEFKYFSYGLTWIDKFNMNNLLQRAKILPDVSQYNAEDLFTAVRNELGVDPDIQCLTNHKTGDVYLFEIRICFTKALELTDCDGIKLVTKQKAVITNCPAGKVIVYPTKVPPVDTITQSKITLPRMQWLLDLLYFLQWLQWLTL